MVADARKATAVQILYLNTFFMFSSCLTFFIYRIKPEQKLSSPPFLSIFWVATINQHRKLPTCLALFSEEHGECQGIFPMGKGEPDGICQNDQTVVTFMRGGIMKRLDFVMPP
jgi:hypothetical protein